jgi:hypothetical protein
MYIVHCTGCVSRLLVGLKSMPLSTRSSLLQTLHSLFSNTKLVKVRKGCVGIVLRYLIWIWLDPELVRLGGSNFFALKTKYSFVLEDSNSSVIVSVVIRIRIPVDLRCFGSPGSGSGCQEIGKINTSLN